MPPRVVPVEGSSRARPHLRILRPTEFASRLGDQDPQNLNAMVDWEDPETILLVYPTEVDNAKDMARILAHENVHQALHRVNEPQAFVGLDAMPRYASGSVRRRIERNGLYRAPPQWRERDEARKAERMLRRAIEQATRD